MITKITIIIITTYLSVSLELRSTSASIKSSRFLSLCCICIVLNTLEDGFFLLFLSQNQYKLLQYKFNDFFLLELYYQTFFLPLSKYYMYPLI